MKLVVDAIETVAEPLRSEYEARDGKFYLKVEGDNPALTAANLALGAANIKVVEFRDKNIELLKEVDTLRPIKAKFEGIDPEEAKAAIAKVVALGKKGIKGEEDIDIRVKAALDEQLKPYNETLTQMRQRVEKSEADALADRHRADEYLFQTQIADRFIKVGGKAKATDFIVGLAKETFEIKDKVLTTKSGKFNPEKPGELISIEDWLTSTLKEHDYTVEPSKGGGAPTVKSAGGATLKAGQTLLKNPTPQELGQFASEIAAGKIKVENDVVTH